MSPEYCAMPSTLQHPCSLSHSVSNMIPTWHRSKPQPPPSNGSGIANIPHSCFLLSAHGDRRAHAPRNALLTGKKACSQAGTLSGACAGTYSNVLVNTGHWLRKRPRTQHTQGAGPQTAGRESASFYPHLRHSQQPQPHCSSCPTPKGVAQPLLIEERKSGWGMRGCGCGCVHSAPSAHLVPVRPSLRSLS